MCTFIEEYLHNPSQAIAAASETLNANAHWSDDIDENLIYAQIASPEFRLYEEIIFSPAVEDITGTALFATVA